ncbi:hypothetical protein [Streptomyces noursei]|uniref:hypothetical protein n=1 Tax=Streptomyces noursei TaxID=1971 RepID=UPI00167C1C41|nr:hypothetical protein [Streptomyces noursei]MCZ1016876.1 hypothetical protein [Streptomyces noursei]
MSARPTGRRALAVLAPLTVPAFLPGAVGAVLLAVQQTIRAVPRRSVPPWGG